MSTYTVEKQGIGPSSILLVRRRGGTIHRVSIKGDVGIVRAFKTLLLLNISMLLARETNTKAVFTATRSTAFHTLANIFNVHLHSAHFNAFKTKCSFSERVAVFLFDDRGLETV